MGVNGGEAKEHEELSVRRSGRRISWLLCLDADLLDGSNQLIGASPEVCRRCQPWLAIEEDDGAPDLVLRQCTEDAAYATSVTYHPLQGDPALISVPHGDPEPENSGSTMKIGGVAGPGYNLEKKKGSTLHAEEDMQMKKVKTTLVVYDIEWDILRNPDLLLHILEAIM
ncbi:hypothetical protein ACLOJK_026797 [Asimina triloba]